MERLEAGIDLDTKGLEAGVLESRKILRRLEGQLLSLKTKLETTFDGSEQTKLTNRIRQTETAISNVKSRMQGQIAQLDRYRIANQNATISQNKLNQSVGRGNGVAIEFSRIIQDAPFGIIGVGNNITRLAETFGQLRASSASTGQALKTALFSIISPANLVVLGISAVTTAFTIFALQSQKTETEVKSLDDRLQDFLKTLDQVDKASIDTSRRFDEEAFKLDALNSILTDGNTNYNQRKNALEAIQKDYGKYLNNLDDETALVEGLGDNYDRVLEALKAKAVLQANEKQINDVFKEQAELTARRAKDEERFIELQDSLVKARNRVARAQELVDTGQVKGTRTLNEAKEEVELYIEALNAYETRITETSSALDNNKGALDNLKNGYVDALKTLNDLTKGTEDAKEEIDDYFKELLAIDADIKRKLQVQLDVGVSDAKIIEKYEAIKAQIEEQSKGKPVVIDFEIGLPDSPTQIDAPDINTPALLQNFIDSADELLPANDVLSDVLANLSSFKELEEILSSDASLEDKFSAIGDNAQLLQNTFDNLGSAIVSAFGNGNSALGTFLGQLVSFVGRAVAQYLILSKAQAVASATETASKIPFGAFALPGIVAGALAVVGKAFGGGAGGGGVSSGIGTSNAQSRTIEGAFRGSLNPFGGQFQLTTDVNGSDLQLILKRTENKNA